MSGSNVEPPLKKIVFFAAEQFTWGTPLSPTRRGWTSLQDRNGHGTVTVPSNNDRASSEEKTLRIVPPDDGILPGFMTD